MASVRDAPALYLLLGSTLLVTGVVHVVFLPAYFPTRIPVAIPFLLVGWGSFGLAFYAMGRLFSSPGPLPEMGAADAGLALVLFSLLLAGGLDFFGFPPELVLEAYVLPAVGLYTGLALSGWSIGKRTKAINRMASGNEE